MTLGTRDSGLGHAAFELESRHSKARKIERLLALNQRPGSQRLLEVGTGAGGIANYFGTHPSGRYSVDAVDVLDNRLTKEGYRFAVVTDTELPFADESFDVVLSNHVIEHVGGEAEQRSHLAQLRRVLSPDGVCYLAVPNRWMLVEPHYRLPFLSWLPRPLADFYIRTLRKGSHYDCNPLRLGQLEKMLDAAGFRHENLCVPALRATFAIEGTKSRLQGWVSRMPDPVLNRLLPLVPTLIYRLQR